jgi:pSer/pThr/pTyr-binding forkhead associated (FHA) protein
VIVCDNCGRENQDHYKFCLGCGAELKREAAQPKSFTAPTPPAGVPAAKAPATQMPPPSRGEPDTSAPTTPSARTAPSAPVAPTFGGSPVQGGGQGAGARPTGAADVAPGLAPTAAVPAVPQRPAPAATPAQPAQPAVEQVACPQCGQENPANFKFCGACGFNLEDWRSKGSPPLSADGTATGAPAPSPEPAPQPAGGAALVIIRPDGSEGDRVPLEEGSVTIGRELGEPFSQDTFLSPRHARFELAGGGMRVTDEGSLNGVYVRLEREAPVELRDGAVFRIGQEIIRFERLAPPQTDAEGVEIMGAPDPGYLGRLCLVVGRSSVANCFCVPERGMHMGRERGDIIFPDDGYVSGLHCRIHGESGKVWLTDVGSSNGTFFRVDGSHEVPPGALVLMGQQLFRVEV